MTRLNLSNLLSRESLSYPPNLLNRPNRESLTRLLNL